MNAPCPRIWEAEAIEDGRLDALGATSFERHVAQCRECAREASTLRKLRDSFELFEPRRPSILEERRQRAELLRLANRRILTDQDGRGRLLRIIGVAAVIPLMFAIVAVGWRRLRPRITARRETPVFELRAIDGATFHDETAGARGRVVLSNGSLAVHVEHLLAEQSFVLVVPEGELAVHGTRFIADVVGGRTERVLVTEGTVTVRFSGIPERILGAGESWTRSPAPVPASSSILADAESERGRARADVERVSSIATNASRNSRRSPMVGLPVTDGVSSTSGARREPTRDVAKIRTEGSVDPTPYVSDGVQGAAAARAFERAMAAFTSGAYLEADEQLAAFAARFPADGRREDAAFLRAVIATKRGDAAAAVARARAYLSRFPRGLRRAEMERLVNAPW